MCDSPFRRRLIQEFDARRARNPRYSLRAFAGFLGLDHATLTQILKGRRGMPKGRIHDCARRLGMSAEEASAYFTNAGEALNVIDDPVHWRIVQLCRSAEFRPDCHWIAARLQVSTDQVNVAVTRLISFGLLRMRARTEWWCENFATEREFRMSAVAAVNQNV